MGTDAGAWRENRATRCDQGSHIRGVLGCNENAGWKGKRLSIPPGFQLGGCCPEGREMGAQWVRFPTPSCSPEPWKVPKVGKGLALQSDRFPR